MQSPHDYRLYQLDRTGHIIHADIILCESDVEAVQAALERSITGPYPVEVWCRSRYIGQFPSITPMPAVVRMDAQSSH